MSKFAENVIKFAYENRANAMIAAKQAADEKGLIEKISAWLERNPQAKRGLISGGVAGIGGASAYGITRALGGSKGKAWTATGITAPVAGGISEAVLNRKEIAKGAKSVGESLKKLLYGKSKEQWVRPNKAAKHEADLQNQISQNEKAMSVNALKPQTDTVVQENDNLYRDTNRARNHIQAMNNQLQTDDTLSPEEQMIQRMANQGDPQAIQYMQNRK